MFVMFWLHYGGLLINNEHKRFYIHISYTCLWNKEGVGSTVSTDYTCSKLLLAVRLNEQAVDHTNGRYPSGKTSNSQFLGQIFILFMTDLLIYKT